MQNISMSDAELLKYAIEHGMIDTALVQEKVEMQKREEILSKHPYNIWEGKDGYWRTYLPDEEKMGYGKGSYPQSKLGIFKVVVYFVSQCQKYISYETENICRQKSHKQL